jgi:hypothetical protein
MTPPARFPADVVEAVRACQVLGVRAGTDGHRVIAVWAVVVEGRVFVRSWSVSPGGWYRAFLREPRGAMAIGGRELAVRAVRTRSERLKAAVDEAYLAKYRTPAAMKYTRDLCAPRSRATTTELVPA